MSKKNLFFISAAALIFANSVFAANEANSAVNNSDSGPYAGFQLGYVKTSYKAGAFVDDPSPKVDNQNIGGRVYGGFAFDQHLATEIGYTYYGSPKFTAGNTGEKDNFSQHGLDIVARASIPFSSGLGAHVKAGGTWIYRTAFATDDGVNFISKGSNSKFALVTGGALTLNASPRVMVDLSWTHINKNGDLASTNFYALGLNYKLGR